MLIQRAGEASRGRLFLVENKQRQIPRSARDDTVGGYVSLAC
jgi:hypothetical protein